MKRLLRPALLLTLVLAVFSGCVKGNTLKTTLDKQNTVAIGQTVKIATENLSIKLIDITNDSRCPQGVTCIWAGEVSCVLEITLNGKTDNYTLVVLGSGDTAGTAYNGYQLIGNVTPYPKQGVTINKADYHMTLIVNKAP